MTAPALTAIGIMFLGSLMALVVGPRLRAATLAAFPLSLVALVVGFVHQGGGWWEVDRIGLALGVTALVIGTCACRYAQRQFDGERRGARILAASLMVVGAVLATDLAQNQMALIISWVMTSASTVLLLRVGSSSWRSDVVRRATATFLVADGILVLGIVTAGMLSGHIGVTTTLTATTDLGGTSAAIMLMAAALAAVGRAGLTTRTSWVSATISTPTSVSALLHAGVVNAGALLLLRVELATGSPWWMAVALGVTCATVLVLLAPRIHARVDLKGQLAASTISQMAFMLLAIALGWPLLALTHLVGHGLYKAGRFMATGGAIEARTRLRRRAPSGEQLDRRLRVLGVGGLLVVAAAVGVVIGGDALAAMGVMGPAGAVVWWVRTDRPLNAGLRSWAVLGAGIAIYGAVIGGVQHVLGSSMPISAWRAPWWSLGAAVVLVAMVTAQRRHGQARVVTSGVEPLRQLRGQHVGEVAA